MHPFPGQSARAQLNNDFPELIESHSRKTRIDGLFSAATGPLDSLKLRARSAAGGPGKVWWKTAEQDEFPAQKQIVEFTLAAGDDWQEIAVDLPTEGLLSIVRLYLPVRSAAVEIEVAPTRASKRISLDRVGHIARPHEDRSDECHNCHQSDGAT